MSAALGQNVCHALPGFHSLTGCDSVRAFVGKGKAQGLQLLKSNEAIQKHLQMLGREFCPSDFDSLARSCEEVVCALYGYAHNNINDVRYAMLCSKAGDSSQLPRLVMIFCSTYTGRTTRLRFGTVRWRHSPMFQTQVLMDGLSMGTVIW